MQKNQTVKLHELFQHVMLEAHATWRYRWHALIVVAGTLMVGALLVFGMPSVFESSAQVYADTDALMNPLLHGLAVQPDVRDRLQIITHTVLSRPNLETVADTTGLALRATTPQDRDQLLVKLGGAVKVKSAGVNDLYDITYDDRNPAMAQKVVQAFLRILMNDTLGANASSTAAAQDFLQQQLQDYGNRLNDAEKKLANFEKANVGYIPSQGGSDYFTRLQTAETQLQNLQNQYDTAVASRDTTEQQMRAMQTNPASSGVDPRVQQINQQIATYQQTLNTLLLSYTDKYPDVIATRLMVTQLEQRRAALQKAAASGTAMGVASDNPVYQDMQKGLYTTEVNIRTLATQIALQKQQIATLKGKIDTITDVQVNLQQLTRNYDATKKKYNELLARVDTAQMSQDAAHSGNNLKFRVISPPIIPLLPVSPKRGLLLLMVFVLALAIGGGFAYFLHKIKPVFVSLESLRQFADYHVLGSFSLITSERRELRQRREAIEFATGVGLLAILVALGFAFDGSLTHLVQHFFVIGAT